MDYPLCDLFNISPLEISRRKEFMCISSVEDEIIKEIHKVIDEDLEDIVDNFYVYLLKFHELNHFLADSNVLKRLKETQKAYLLSLGIKSDSLEYFEGRLRIGIAHERVGLMQKWYLGAYSHMFELITEKLLNRISSDPRKLFLSIITLYKIMMLDSELAVETYYQATTSRLENIMAELDKAHQRLQEVSRLDGLTQVLNRHTFMEALEAELHRCVRYQHPLTLAMIDLDHFKEVNDRFGHQFGDYVLQKTIQLIKSSARISDIIGRYGGEEFCIVLVETDIKSAISELERLRLKVASTKYEYEGKQDYLTVSIGVSGLTPSLKNKEELISNADKSLMEAKEAGRNTLRVYENIDQ